MTDTLLTSLRERRTEAGLSQAALAARVGISRQALNAIEGGRQVPSTTLSLALARVLHCNVEELFALAEPPRLEATLVGRAPGGRLLVGRVDGRWIAHPAGARDRPADALLVGRPAAAGAALVEPLGELSPLEHNALVAGCAPLLGVLAARVGRRYHDARATWIAADSARALRLLARGQVHVAGIHLAGGDDPGAHVRAARRAVRGQRALLINLARWRQGLVVAPGNPLGLDAGARLLRPGLRLATRERGAGAQKLLERVLREAGKGKGKGEGRGRGRGREEGEVLAADHDEVARMVRWGVVDAGVAIESVALAEGLDFIPLVEERFDLIVPAAHVDEPAVARLLDLIDRPSFRAEAAGMPGYDLSLAGHLETVSAG